jgi:hypothetical protein
MGVRRPLSFLAIVLAWVCAQGAAMDAVQVFAWARMFAGYAVVMDWSEALSETFDPAKPCEICGAIKTAREAEERAPAAPVSPEVAKVVLFVSAEETAVAPPSVPSDFVTRRSRASEWQAPVPTPPPRHGAA